MPSEIENETEEDQTLEVLPVPKPLAVRATVTLRHEMVISAREKKGLNQSDAAELAGISLLSFRRIETLDFTHKDAINHADAISIALEIPVTDILPDGWVGTCSPNKISKSMFVAPQLLPETAKRLEGTSVIDAASAKELKEKIGCALNNLTYRQREVLKLRYGIGDSDGYTYTLDEVGRIFHVSVERVRAIELEAFSKLRRPTTSRHLLPFIEQC